MTSSNGARILVTGATGLAGSEVLRQALSDPEVARVTALARRRPKLTHAKLEVVLHEDFGSYADLAPRLRGHDACVWCLGVSQRDVRAKEYERITFDYAVAAAGAFYGANPDARFCFLSRRGADSSEKSRLRFARVKGKAENHLLRHFPRVYCFRPGYIRAVHGRPLLSLGRVTDAVAKRVANVAPDHVVGADELALAMLHVAKRGALEQVLENSAILALAARARRGPTVADASTVL